jgi:hypothetical protein
MESPRTRELKDKLLAIAADAKTAGLTVRFYSDSVCVLCLADDAAEETKTKEDQPPRERKTRRDGGKGNDEGTLL